jgi:hypothetical protein
VETNGRLTKVALIKRQSLVRKTCPVNAAKGKKWMASGPGMINRNLKQACAKRYLRQFSSAKRIPLRLEL